ECIMKKMYLFLMLRCSLSYAKITQTECIMKKMYLFLMLRCSLSYAKITLISQSDAFYMDYVMISFITIKIGTADFSGRWQEIITS
ncbi:hypothetical protein, partial [Prevotella pectinovora]